MSNDGTQRMHISPIETIYNNWNFRSRLEARWAVLLDYLGIVYEYEREGFDCGEAGWYLPDFWLPDYQCWLEIKPGALLEHEEKKALALSMGFPVIIGTNIEDSMTFRGFFAGLEVRGPYMLMICQDCKKPSFLDIYAGVGERRELVSPTHIKGCECIRRAHWDSLQMDKAITAARFARFEHGAKNQATMDSGAP